VFLGHQKIGTPSEDLLDVGFLIFSQNKVIGGLAGSCWRCSHNHITFFTDFYLK
jgi:hypothetical protein